MFPFLSSRPIPAHSLLLLLLLARVCCISTLKSQRLVAKSQFVTALPVTLLRLFAKGRPWT